MEDDDEQVEVDRNVAVMPAGAEAEEAEVRRRCTHTESALKRAATCVASSKQGVQLQ